jgi:hypothetical protein
VARWRILKRRRFDPHSTSRTAKRAWALDAADGQTGTKVTVQVFQVDYPDEAFPDECRLAISSGGRSALKPYLGEAELPRVILLTTDGVCPQWGSE